MSDAKDHPLKRLTVQLRPPKPRHVDCMTPGCDSKIKLDRPRLFDSRGFWNVQLDNPSRRYFCDVCRSGVTK